MGHLSTEGVQFLYIALNLCGEFTVEGIRREVGRFLDDLKHCNGWVTLRDFKNYLLR